MLEFRGRSKKPPLRCRHTGTTCGPDSWLISSLHIAGAGSPSRFGNAEKGSITARIQVRASSASRRINCTASVLTRLQACASALSDGSRSLSMRRAKYLASAPKLAG